MLAVLRDNKDHETLIRGWRLFLDAHPQGDPCLLLPGRADNAQDRIKALAFDLGLSGTVKFLGHVDDVTGLLAACDLAVFATRYEGVPNGVLESMAMGLAVVGADHPGLREALGPTASAECLCTASDPAALAGAIGRFATDDELRARHGRLNRVRIEEHFAAERACRMMGDVIVRALAN
jgi:glycosyltransferase involved in cell wall biosynthesis